MDETDCQQYIICYCTHKAVRMKYWSDRSDEQLEPLSDRLRISIIDKVQLNNTYVLI